MEPIDIQIRRSEPADYRGIHAIYSQPKVISATLQMPFPSLDEWKDKLTDQSSDMIRLVACVDSDIVGTCVLRIPDRQPRRRHVGILNMAVHDAWQGRGVGTALMYGVFELADRWLDLKRLELTVFAENERAIRFFKKRGFSPEGTLSDYAFRDSEFADAIVMARLR